MGFRVLLDSGLHVQSCQRTEAPAAARDVDNAAPLVTAGGRWAATWAGSLDAARAASASGLVVLCHSLLFVASRRLSPISSSSFCTADSERNRKGPWFYLKAACHPLPNSAAGDTESGLRPYEGRGLSISAPEVE